MRMLRVGFIGFSAFLLLLQLCFFPVGHAVASEECRDCKGDNPLTEVPPNNLKAGAFKAASKAASSTNTLVFRTDTAPELDQYDCGSSIEFDINVTGVNLSAVSKVTLSMAVYDVDYTCSRSSCERDTVFINGNRLTTPVNYLTGANSQWSNVSFDVPPAYLVDGANRILVNIDILNAGWCVEVDYGQLTIEQTGGPELIDILMDGDKSTSQFVVPYTGKDYPITFNVEGASGYTLKEVTGTVDNSFLPSKKTSLKKRLTKDEWFVHFDTNNRGENTLSCQLTYVHDSSGTTYTLKGERKFSLFFERDYVSKLLGITTSKPLWFKYWKEDGAVPGFDSTVKYDGSRSSYGYVPSGSETVYLCSAASGTHYDRAINVPTGSVTESFGGPTVNGIDCASEIIAHERYHVWVGNQWKTGGSFNGKDDSDKSNDGTENDRLPDFYETATSGTSNGDTDTYDLETLKHSSYKRYGDEEFMAMKAGDGARGDKTKDWSAPGKQYTGPSPRVARTRYKMAALGASRVDTDNNGFYDILAITVPVNIAYDDTFTFVGLLSTQDGTQIAMGDFYVVNLTAGTQNITFNFDGQSINRSALDGPYVLSYNYTNGLGEDYTSVDPAYTTPAWGYSSFEGQQIKLNGTYSFSAVDNDTDGTKDVLNVTAQVNVASAGDYTIAAKLVDNYGVSIGYVETTTTLAVGAGQSVVLPFPKTDIVSMRASSPWNLASVVIKDENDAVVEYAEPAYEIAGLDWTDFTSSPFISTGISDSGSDTNGNNYYDYLNISIPVNVPQTGNYVLTGKLFDSNGRAIESASVTTSLNSGSQTVVLQFKGALIWQNGVNGPYRLSYVVAYNDQGEVVDTMAKDYTTQSYAYTAFEGPSVTVLGNYAENAVDSNNDGEFESLDISFDFYVTHDGTYAVNGRLIDANGNEIIWASTQVSLNAGDTGTATLSFNGPTIHAGGSGPYQLIDLYIYNTTNTTYSVTVLEAYTTEVNFNPAYTPASTQLLLLN